MRGRGRWGRQVGIASRQCDGRDDRGRRVLEVGDVVALETAQETFAVGLRGVRLLRAGALAHAGRALRALRHSDAVKVRRADKKGVAHEREQQQRGRERRRRRVPVFNGKSKSQSLSAF